MQAALAVAKRKKATLIIAKLDRLARNVAFISALMETNVEFVAADMPTANRFMLHVYLAMGKAASRAVPRVRLITKAQPWAAAAACQ